MIGALADLAAPAAALLLTYALHSTFFLGGAWLLGRFVLRREAWRDVAWKAALVGGFATTALSIVPGRDWAPRVPAPFSPAAAPAVLALAPHAPPLPRSSEPVDFGVVAVDPAPTDAFAAPSTPVGAGAGVEEGPGRLRAVLSDVANTGAPTILALWAFLALALLARVASRRFRLQQALRNREPVLAGPATLMLDQLRLAAGFRRSVRLTATEAMATPLALGKAEICVPARFFERLSEEEQRVALAHELAHLVRRDPLWHLVAQGLSAVFFFQPLHFVATKKLRESAELLADAWAVRETGARLGLARCLVEVANWISSVRRPEPAGSIGMAEAGSPLMNRVRRLLDGELETVSTSPAARFAAAAVVALAAALAPAVVHRAPAYAVVAMEGSPRLELRVDDPPSAVAQTPTSVSPPPEERVVVVIDERAVDVEPVLDVGSAVAMVAPAPEPDAVIATTLLAGPLLGLEPTILEIETPVVASFAEVERAAPPVRLEEIVVTAGRFAPSERLERVGFYRRRDSGIGTFLDRRDVAGLVGGDFDELFMATAGLHRRCDGLRCDIESRRGFSGFGNSKGCELPYFVDGALFGREAGSLQSDWVEAIEVYRGPSQLPPQFHGPDGGMCGAVVVWTRF